jgi:ribonuclease R
LARRSERKGERRLPTRAEVLEFVQSSPSRVGKREIARAFHVSGADRVPLKALLSEMADEGLLDRGPRKSLKKHGDLPSVAVLDVVDTDPDGELLAAPVSWSEDGPPPRLILTPGGSATPAGPPAGVGDRVLARVVRTDDGYEARLIRTIGASAHRILGVYRAASGGGRIQPVDRKARTELLVAPEDAAGAESGELVVAELLPQRRYGLKRARIRERLGSVSDARAISLIAIHAHNIPVDFPEPALAEATSAAPVTQLGRRTDLRALPLVTIDPEDARDHDDAVWAGADDDPDNAGGWVVVVAIADVAHYVRPGGALDREARKRSNSCYFPDRVVPMLPERLSADLCSLVDGVDRPCLAVRMVFDANGRRKRHVFVRGLMRSAATLTYSQVQRAVDGTPDDATGPLLDPVLRPLYGAYGALVRARTKRQPLDLDMPERRIVLDGSGAIAAIQTRERFDAHRLIEEFMIAANVCAAETLEKRQTACMYRVHETPAQDKVEALRTFLQTLGIPFARAQVLTPAIFNRVLDRVKGTPHQHVVNEIVLRTQMQASYSPDNVGHFGLNLQRYAHFTSPIRRYADLIVHRALIRALDLGGDGLTAEAESALSEIALHISQCERRALAAERESTDRYLAAYMANRLGAQFRGRISGVTRFGLFVDLEESGADGFIPISTLGAEFFVHDEGAHALVGERSGRTYRLGDGVDVRLAEATPITGGLRFELLDQDGGSTAAATGARRPGRSPRPAGRGRTKPKSAGKAGRPARKGPRK